MTLRGYVHQSPLPIAPNPKRWPAYLDTPPEQLALLAVTYRRKPQRRIPLPQSNEQLWAQHKYAILTRDPKAYAAFGRRVARRDSPERLAAVATELSDWLRQPPSLDGVPNAMVADWSQRNFARNSANDFARSSIVACWSQRNFARNLSNYNMCNAIKHLQ
jgi:hypothetical protein